MNSKSTPENQNQPASAAAPPSKAKNEMRVSKQARAGKPDHAAPTKPSKARLSDLIESDQHMLVEVKSSVH